MACAIYVYTSLRLSFDCWPEQPRSRCYLRPTSSIECHVPISIFSQTKASLPSLPSTTPCSQEILSARLVAKATHLNRLILHRQTTPVSAPMKWSNKHPELVNFKDDGYRTRARNMSPDALWVRQCLKYRTKVSSGCGVAFSGLMLLPTLGVSTLGLWVSGRTLDIARRKEKIIDEEVARRHLPNYERKKRDTL